ncbi:MAG: hypothetical protein K1X64_04765 [Myxococcaceae bacterium]|nr:hypothetical protein [Myxococcaceae bacterium]
MTTSRDKVLELVASGKISAAEGDGLLKAMAAPGPGFWHTLWNPFERLSLSVSLALGVAGVLAALVLSHFNVRFDGAFDVHAMNSSVSLSTALIEQAIVWPGVALLFWLGALTLARSARAVDFLAAVAVARLALLPVGIATAPLAPLLPRDVSTTSTTHLLPLIVLVAIALPALALFFVWLYRGFRHASGLRGARCGVAFVTLLVLAEVLSKVALNYLP